MPKPSTKNAKRCRSEAGQCGGFGFCRGDCGFCGAVHPILRMAVGLIGHVMYARSKILSDDGTAIPIMTFGPISIAPKYKRQGYGTILLRHSMAKAKEMGAGALAICGNIGFYGKSGFVVSKTMGVRYFDDPDADYFLICELEPGFLDGISGTYKDPEGYFVSDEEAEAFDAQFPPKEKLKLPGQLF